jgi:aminoglycoside phosphotransferase (APT) family kinase protein
VRRLLAAQFPQWAELPLEPVASAGTDNWIYRLGDDMSVRLPRSRGAIAKVEREQRWLPVLAPQLPLAIPVPLAKGEPGQAYAHPWSVYRWLDGETATAGRLEDPGESAVQLARFVRALQAVDPAGGPPPGPENSGRGEPLAARDERTREAIAALADTIDAEAATAAWDEAVHATAWDGPPVWLHGDLLSSNLLAVDGRITAVIDWGCLGVGDPACDLQPAWSLFSGETRKAFRGAMAVDDATWARGRGWSLSVGLIALPYYRETNPVLAGIARYAIDEVVADHRSHR